MKAKGSHSTWVGFGDLSIPSGRHGCEERIDREGEQLGATHVMARDLEVEEGLCDHSTLTESQSLGFVPSESETLVPPLWRVPHGSLRQPLVRQVA